MTVVWNNTMNPCPHKGLVHKERESKNLPVAATGVKNMSSKYKTAQINDKKTAVQS